MRKPKRITPEQFEVLAKLGMPIYADPCTNSPPLDEDDLIDYLQDTNAQLSETKYYKNYLNAARQPDQIWQLWTLVDYDEEESTEGATSTECV